MVVSFFPKNKEIEHIFDRLTHYPGVSIDTRLALDIGRHKEIKFLRKNNLVFIANDRKRHKSIIFFPPNVKVKKKDDTNGFFFDML